MSYARFSNGDVYVYLTDHEGARGYECQVCRLGKVRPNGWHESAYGMDTDAILDHLRAHHEAGHSVPPDTADAIEADRAENEHWIAFVPFAARWPVEVTLFPRSQVPDIPALSEAQKLALAPIYLQVLRQMEGVFEDTLPAITAWHQAPVHRGRDDFWLHLQIFTIRRAVGKLKFLAGSESAMGAFVNDITPEVAAERLRQVPIEPVATPPDA